MWGTTIFLLNYGSDLLLAPCFCPCTPAVCSLQSHCSELFKTQIRSCRTSTHFISYCFFPCSQWPSCTGFSAVPQPRQTHYCLRAFALAVAFAWKAPTSDIRIATRSPPSSLCSDFSSMASVPSFQSAPTPVPLIPFILFYFVPLLLFIVLMF